MNGCQIRQRGHSRDLYDEQGRLFGVIYRAGSRWQLIALSGSGLRTLAEPADTWQEALSEMCRLLDEGGPDHPLLNDRAGRWTESSPKPASLNGTRYWLRGYSRQTLRYGLAIRQRRDNRWTAFANGRAQATFATAEAARTWLDARYEGGGALPDPLPPPRGGIQFLPTANAEEVRVRGGT
jgi:hypothetical protein